MSVVLLWVVSPASDISNGTGFLEPVREGNRILDSFGALSSCRNLVGNGRLDNGQKNRRSFSYTNTGFRYSCLGNSGLGNKNRLSVASSLVASPAGGITLSSEQKVYDVVLKQVELVKRHLKSTENMEVNVPCSSLFNIVTVRCGHCANLLSVNVGALLQSFHLQDFQIQKQQSSHPGGVKDNIGSSSRSNMFATFQAEHVQPKTTPIRQMCMATD